MPDGIKRITETYQNNAVTVKTTHKDTDLPEIDQYYVELVADLLLGGFKLGKNSILG